MDLEKILLNLSKQLYPTGRAFQMPPNGYIENLHKALAKSEKRAVDVADSILDSLIPDNNNFTQDDAAEWEYRLGLITNTATSLPDRRAAILRKLSQPGINPAKQHYLHIQNELQLAGFNVYVYENRFPNYPSGYVTQTPIAVSSSPSIQSVPRTGTFRHKQRRHGAFYNNVVANHITAVADYGFDTGSNFKSTFFIGGNPLGSFANVPTARETEFRQLILRLKPAQTVGFLFINYI